MQHTARHLQTRSTTADGQTESISANPSSSERNDNNNNDNNNIDYNNKRQAKLITRGFLGFCRRMLCVCLYLADTLRQYSYKLTQKHTQAANSEKSENSHIQKMLVLGPR